MKRLFIIVFFLLIGLSSYGQSNRGSYLLNKRGMYILGHFLPGIEQTFTEKRTALGCTLTTGAIAFGGYAIYEQSRIHNYKIKLDGDPYNSLFYEEKISKATKARNIALIGLGTVELINIITLWTGYNSPIQLAYYPNYDAYGFTYAYIF